MPKKTSKQTEQNESTENVDQTEQVTETTGATEDVDIPKVHCSELDVKRIGFNPQEMNKGAESLTCFPKYLYDEEVPATEENFKERGRSIIILTEPVKMFKGGIPKHNVKYHGTDPDSMKRAYFYIPRNEKDPASKELFDKMHEVDEYMHEEINVKKNENGIMCVLVSKGTGKNAKLIKKKVTGVTYSRMITTAKKPADNLFDNEGDEGDEGESGESDKKSVKKNGKDSKTFGKQEKEFVPWDRIKVRFATPYDENAGPEVKKPITTQIFVGDKEEPEECTTVSQVGSHFMWGCRAQFVLMFSRLWIMTSTDKKCGIAIKCLQIGITEQPEPRKAGASITKQLNKSLFAKKAPLVITKNNNDENTQSVTSTTKTTSKVTAKPAVATASVKTPVKTTTKILVKPEAKSLVKTPTKSTAKVPAKVDEPEEDEGDDTQNVENADGVENTDDTDDTDNTDNTEAPEENIDNNEDGNTSEPEVDVPPPKKQSTKGNTNDVKVKAKTVENSTSKTVKKPIK